MLFGTVKVCRNGQEYMNKWLVQDEKEVLNKTKELTYNQWIEV